MVLWLKEHGNSRARQQVIETARSFRSIPGVVRVAAGRVVPSRRTIVDSSFDVALVVTFRDEQSMRSYLDHPHHQEAVKNVLNPLVDKIIVYDFLD